jgi:1-deoxy-D-xylulose-5-phosphate synthase
MERAQELGVRDVAFHRIGIPDEYVHHGSQDVLRAQYDLHAEGIACRVREFVNGTIKAEKFTAGTVVGIRR